MGILDPPDTQIDEIFQKLIGIKIRCEQCGKKVNLNYCYQCFDCNYWFCKDCAVVHFACAKRDAVK